jgi:hypothetical protein
MGQTQCAVPNRQRPSQCIGLVEKPLYPILPIVQHLQLRVSTLYTWVQTTFSTQSSSIF